MSTVPFSPHDSLMRTSICKHRSSAFLSYRYILGEEVASFEREYANYLGVEYCVGVANGTDAINIALRAVGVTSSDCVLATANAGFYSSASILQIGAC